MTVFADTFFYLALFNTRDAYHGRVLDFMANFTGGVVTTQWVLTEELTPWLPPRAQRSVPLAGSPLGCQRVSEAKGRLCLTAVVC